MDNNYIYLNAEEGLNIGSSLSDQLGCFSVAVAAIAITAVIIGGITTALVRLFY